MISQHPLLNQCAILDKDFFFSENFCSSDLKELENWAEKLYGTRFRAHYFLSERSGCKIAKNFDRNSGKSCFVISRSVGSVAFQ